MTVPITGAYVSENKDFTVNIISANPSNSVIKAGYETNYSPEGSFSDERDDLGHYSWVKPDGMPPFNISFFARKRPNERSYCIYDMWTGFYLKNNTLQMTGVRSYVNNTKKEVQTICLGTLTFSQK